VFNKTSEYALRAVAAIAQGSGDRPVLAKDIAKGGDIPAKYLSKVLGDLVRAGVLSSTRGIGGGFRLRQPPENVPLIEVVRPFEDVLASRRCPFGNPRCSDASPCPIHEQWKPVSEAYRSFLEQTTVADILRDRARRGTV
jgi:Rrf2 family protein